jgi:hypothetical protein
MPVPARPAERHRLPPLTAAVVWPPEGRSCELSQSGLHPSRPPTRTGENKPSKYSCWKGVFRKKKCFSPSALRWSPSLHLLSYRLFLPPLRCTNSLHSRNGVALTKGQVNTNNEQGQGHHTQPELLDALVVILIEVIGPCLVIIS